MPDGGRSTVHVGPRYYGFVRGGGLPGRGPYQTQRAVREPLAGPEPSADRSVEHVAGPRITVAGADPFAGEIVEVGSAFDRGGAVRSVVRHDPEEVTPGPRRPARAVPPSAGGDNVRARPGSGAAPGFGAAPHP